MWLKFYSSDSGKQGQSLQSHVTIDQKSGMFFFLLNRTLTYAMPVRALIWGKVGEKKGEVQGETKLTSFLFIRG